MKKNIFLVICLIGITSCSIKTNEDKARELVETEVKKYLYKPESYKFSNIQIDSCFDDTTNPDAIDFALELSELYNNYKRYSHDVENAIETNLIDYCDGDSSSFIIQRFNREVEVGRRNALREKERIVELFKRNKNLFINKTHTFIGWRVILSFVGETNGGWKTSSLGFFFLNKDMTKIIAKYSETDILRMGNFEDVMNEVIYVFEDDLKNE